MSYGPSDRAAVLAARLIARDGVRWRDALESVTLECGERPSDDRVATELRRWYSTFDPDQHRRSLRKKRNAALAVMTFFEESLGNVEPKLVGRVLDGAASRDAVAEANGMDELEGADAFLRELADEAVTEALERTGEIFVHDTGGANYPVSECMIVVNRAKMPSTTYVAADGFFSGWGEGGGVFLEPQRNNRPGVRTIHGTRTTAAFLDGHAVAASPGELRETTTGLDYYWDAAGALKSCN